MGIINNDNTIVFFTENGYNAEKTIMDNGNNGFFIVGTVQTPVEWIGKNIILKAFIVGDD